MPAATISFSNISLLTIGTTPQSCVVTFDVTSSTTPAAPVNQINAHTMGSTSGITNNLAADATLTVNTGVAISKTFVPATLPIGTVGYVRFLITNTASSSPLTSGSLVDNMNPGTVVLASTTLGPTQAGDPASCGGSLNPAEVDTATFHLMNMTVAGATGVAPVTPAQCVVYVPVIAAPGVAPGPISNSIAAGALVIGGQTNQGGTTANGTQGPAPNVSIAKAFVSTVAPFTNTIQPGGTATLTITITNNAAGAAALTGMAVTDTLPPGITIAAVPAASTTCGAGTVTAVAGGNTVALNNGSLGTITAPTGSCTITVNVTGSTNGIYTNTISAGTLTTTQGAVNGNPAQAILNIGNTSGVGITKAFLSTVIPPGGTSMLTVTIVNNAATAVALTNLGVTDTLPANVTVGATPNASTTCAGGTATAVAGGSTLTLVRQFACDQRVVHDLGKRYRHGRRHVHEHDPGQRDHVDAGRHQRRSDVGEHHDRSAAARGEQDVESQRLERYAGSNGQLHDRGDQQRHAAGNERARRRRARERHADAGIGEGQRRCRGRCDHQLAAAVRYARRRRVATVTYSATVNAIAPDRFASHEHRNDRRRSAVHRRRVFVDVAGQRGHSAGAHRDEADRRKTERARRCR